MPEEAFEYSQLNTSPAAVMPANGVSVTLFVASVVTWSSIVIAGELLLYYVLRKLRSMKRSSEDGRAAAKPG